MGVLKIWEWGVEGERESDSQMVRWSDGLVVG